MAQPPVLAQAIPSQIIHEGASYGPFDLKKYIQSAEDSGELRFVGELSNGRPLPAGLICTSTGLVAGIPANGTQGDYDVVILIENDSGIPLTVNFKLSIKARMTTETEQFYTKLKSQIWDALGKNLPLPEMDEIFGRNITAAEFYYLLERFAYLKVWDVYNLDLPSEKKLLKLKGASEHYNVYDCGSCLVAAPKELFSDVRTLADALQTARALAHEAAARDWIVELDGNDKMMRALWIESRLMGDASEKYLEILHFNPTNEDVKIYVEQSRALAARAEMNL